MDPDGHYKDLTYTKITIKAPQGKLGIRLIDQIVGHDCRWKITFVDDDSPLVGKIYPGDSILSIDNIDVSRMNAKMFESTFQKRRDMARMEFLRAVSPPVVEVSNSSTGGRRIASINNRNRVGTPVKVVGSNSSDTPIPAATIATLGKQQSIQQDNDTIAAATHVTNRGSTVAESSSTNEPQSVVSTWTCSKCTFINDEGSDETDNCIMCQGLRDSPSILDDPTTANASETVYSNFASSSSEVSKRKDPPEERLSSAYTDDAVKWTSPNVLQRESSDSNGTGDISSNQSSSYNSNRLSSRRYTTDSSLRFSTLMHDLEEEEANDEGGNDRAHSSISMHDLEEGKENDGGGVYRASAQGSMSHLGNMSFAAWEADRKHWTCEVCTFKNEPRFLMCGGCGMAEGCTAIEDELIAQGLERMSLSKAQDFLMNAVHKQLDLDHEDNVRHERAVELLTDRIKDEYSYDASNFERQMAALDFNETEQKESSKLIKAREHIETLERVQQAEREEHEDMLFTLEQWKEALVEEPNEEQFQQMINQEQQLKRLMKEWEDREVELRQLRMRLDGNLATI